MCTNSNGVVQFDDKLHLAMQTVGQLKANKTFQNLQVHVIEVETLKNYLDIPDIAVFDKFGRMLESAVEDPRNHVIIICPKVQDVETFQSLWLLMGSYLILRRKLDLDEVVQSLDPVVAHNETLSPVLSEKNFIKMQYGLGAISQAKKMFWIGAVDHAEPAGPAFDLDLRAHYASPVNGNVHILVPGKLVFFPTPRQLPGDQLWVDIGEPGLPTERHFSAAFLADVLEDFDVSVVVCLGESSGASATAFADRGLDVHDLRLDPSCPSLLGAMDRLLALTRAAPGAVAVFPGEGLGWEQGSGLAGRLGAACLTREYGFEAGEAGAWLQMACPALLGSLG
jgi:hypothetical protein